MLLLIPAFFILLLIALKIYLRVVFVRYKSNQCLIGKTALVTGANSGIGYQIALALASRGCRVIVAARELNSDLKENTLRETNSRNIVYHHLDLASFKSVKEFANCIIKSEDKLDILIHNAAIVTTRSVLTEDGLDMTLQVNYLSPFLLTHLLIDLLKTSSGRIIFTSSISSYAFDLSLKYLTPPGVNKDMHSFIYAHSKFGVILIADLFAKKLKTYNITCNSYHPGLVNSRIFKKTLKQSAEVVNPVSLFIRVMGILSRFLGKTPEEGAQTALYLACANEVKDVTGMYFYNMKPTYKPKKLHDKEFCNDIWKATEELVKLEPHKRL